MRWITPTLVLVVGLAIASAAGLSNRYFVIEREDNTLLKLDHITGTTYEYSHSFGWQPMQRRLLVKKPPTDVALATITGSSLYSHDPTVTVNISNETDSWDMTYALVSVYGRVDGKLVVGGTAEVNDASLPPGWLQTKKIDIQHFGSGHGPLPENIELETTVVRAAFKKALFTTTKLR